MIPERRIPTHPGVVLRDEFLTPTGDSEPEQRGRVIGFSQTAFAARLGIPLQRVNEIVKGKRGATADTAWRFALALGTTPEFWMNLQANRDLALARPKAVTLGGTVKRMAKRVSKAASRRRG